MRYALIAPVALLAVPAAAQDLPPVAGQTVEITLAGHGEAEQEGQGFQVTAMFYSYGAETAARRQVAQAAIEEVKDWDLPFRSSCLSASRLGFVGNAVEAVSDAVDAELATEETIYAPPSSPMSPLYYSGHFADDESFARASERLQAGGVQLVSTMAVAFDCSAAQHAARTAALADAYRQADMLAAELGMRVIGMTSADFSSGDPNEWLQTAITAMSGQEGTMMARVTANVTFTFARRVVN